MARTFRGLVRDLTNKGNWGRQGMITEAEEQHENASVNMAVEELVVEKQ
jgi:hypothetical protein